MAKVPASKEDTTAKIKEEMALPPIPQGRTRAPRNRTDRDRNRVRLDITIEQALDFLQVLLDSLRGIPVDSTEFKNKYAVYRNLKVQADKLAAKNGGGADGK